MRWEYKYKEAFVETDHVKLQYLDWGGHGQVLILICGAGDTPFLFENLAESLSAHFRVIGYSRRNHGKSKSREDKYDNDTLVADLKLLLDTLKIDKANFLGWSLGGNEISGFAVKYPDRIVKLIYFESGYDLADGGFAKLVSNIPRSYLPDNSVTISLDKYREWYHHFWFADVKWNNALEDNLRASVKVNADGSIETIPSNDVFRSILSEAINCQRSYQKIQAPSLVIYTKSFFYPPDDKPSTKKLYDSIENNIVSPWRIANRKRIETELQNATIVDAPKGTHTSFLFLSNDYLVKTIKNFIDSAK
ncbi:MAG: alpha/beta hydrolase [Bacteroidetes bacterium]|nr:alpha/beta hydrolase [Bacteroidota bacterium]